MALPPIIAFQFLVQVHAVPGDVYLLALQEVNGGRAEKHFYWTSMTKLFVRKHTIVWF